MYPEHGLWGLGCPARRHPIKHLADQTQSVDMIVMLSGGEEQLA
jgi:hypothetical protein